MGVVFIVKIQHILQNKRLNFESGHIGLFSSNLQSDIGFVVSVIHRQLSNPREGKCNKTQTPEGKSSNHPLSTHRLCRPEICQGCWRKQQKQIKQTLQEARRHFSEPLITDIPRDIPLWFCICELLNLSPAIFLNILENTTCHLRHELAAIKRLFQVHLYPVLMQDCVLLLFLSYAHFFFALGRTSHCFFTFLWRWIFFKQKKNYYFSENTYFKNHQNWSHSTRPVDAPGSLLIWSKLFSSLFFQPCHGSNTLAVAEGGLQCLGYCNPWWYQEQECQRSASVYHPLFWTFLGILSLYKKGNAGISYLPFLRKTSAIKCCCAFSWSLWKHAGLLS